MPRSFKHSPAKPSVLPIKPALSPNLTVTRQLGRERAHRCPPSCCPSQERCWVLMLGLLHDRHSDSLVQMLLLHQMSSWCPCCQHCCRGVLQLSQH